MLQEVKNLPSLIQEHLVRRKVDSIVHQSELKARQVASYFRAAGHPLPLTYHESALLHSLLGLWTSRQDPQVIESSSTGERVESYYHQRLNALTQDMGFRESYIAQLIYGSLDELAQVFVTNYQTISIVGEEINQGPNDPYFKSKKVVEIQNIVNQTMEQSVRLVASIRDLEKAYHPLESQLTFRP